MNRRITSAFLVLIFLQSPGAHSQRKPSSPELFDAVWQTINDNFYDPSFGGVDWKAIRQKYSPEVAKVTDDRSFIALAYRMMGELHTSHLEIYPAKAPQVGIGIRTSKMDDQVVVTRLALGSDAQRQGVRIGGVL